jgi:hypothetical protein
MKKLLASGCSFIFGDELEDQQGNNPSNSTFTALLAQDLGLEYRCVAVSGSGSDSHVRQVIENVDQDTGLVVVGWSYAGRFDFNFNKLGWQEIRHVSTRPNWIKDIIEPFHRQFYGNLTLQYQWYHYAKDIVFLQQWLTAKDIPYLFCGMDPDFNNRSVEDVAFQNLYEEINWDNWFFWKTGKENLGFRQWCFDMQAKDPRFNIGMLAHHPLEHAHKTSFDLIKEHLTHKGLYDTYRTSNR